ncbi:MAG: hypothetical protein EON55_23965 [Alphaproteobacteria bacterium]|nr:MAG: hypothetical protein EON55_23965 [Alphaproteobacteria bacterium]
MTEATINEPGIVKRALAGHAAIGLLAGALIYLIAITGAMIVVHDRWQRWEEPSVVETGATLSPVAAQASLGAALEREKDLPNTEHLYIRMPTHDLPRAVVTTDNKRDDTPPHIGTFHVRQTQQRSRPAFHHTTPSFYLHNDCTFASDAFALRAP